MAYLNWPPSACTFGEFTLSRALMRTLVFATLAVVGLLLPAQADPLHGTCAGCTEATIGGNAVTPLTQGATNFGFSISPSGATGNLQLKFLIPNSFTLAQVQTFASAVGVVSGTGAHFPLTLFSTTAWTSGFLETDYLHNTLANGAPKNPRPRHCPDGGEHLLA